MKKNVSLVSRPLFTVLMPVYNSEQFLAEAIESVLNQTIRDFEFLIIDDGSTDASLKIIQKYQRLDSRIRLITRPNKGFIATLKEGMCESNADIIARVDSDDISLPERFRLQYEYLRQNKDCVVVGCQVRTLSQDGVLGGIDPRPTTDYSLKLFLGYGCALSGPTVMFRKLAIQKIGGFKQSGWPAEDYDCWVRLVESDRSVKIHNLPDILYHYRLNDQGISLTNKVAQIQKTINIGNDYRKFVLDTNWKFLSASMHREWLRDIKHIDDREQQEQLKRIYYTTQTWFIKDQRRSRPIGAWVNMIKLRFYTLRYNRDNMPYLQNQPTTHSLPEELIGE